MKSRSCLLTTILFTLAACADHSDGSSAPQPGTEIRDSAGIRVIENAQPMEGSRVWRVGPEPTVSIGAGEGKDPHMLYQVIGAMRLSDGRIVVANSGDGELRFFDALGTHVATSGGEGEGPGEFRSLEQLEPWAGDSIAAWYGPRLGISIFDSEGNFGRNFTLVRNPDDPNSQTVRPRAVTVAGAILAGQATHMSDEVVVEIRDAEGRLRSSLGLHTGSERYIAHEGTERAREYPPTFGATVAQVPWGDLIVHSLNNRYEIEAFTQDGTLARIVRRGHVPRSPTPDDIAAYIEEKVAWYPPDLASSEIEQYRAEKREQYRSVRVAEVLPAFASVIVDRLNHLWVEEYEAPGEERPGSLWTVFDPEGRVLGFVAMPERLEVFEIGEDYILGLWRDDFHVEYVQVWPLERL